MTESFFRLREEDFRRLAISRTQKQFDNEEDKKMREWLRKNASILLNAGEATPSPEGYK